MLSYTGLHEEMQIYKACKPDMFNQHLNDFGSGLNSKSKHIKTNKGIQVKRERRRWLNVRGVIMKCRGVSARADASCCSAGSVLHG